MFPMFLRPHCPFTRPYEPSYPFELLLDDELSKTYS